VAIYRFEAKIIGRSERAGGRSVVAAAAYRSASKLADERYEVIHDYSRRAAGVEYAGIHSPEASPAWATERGSLWNGIEAKEDTHNRRASAQLAREYIPAIPTELDSSQRKALVLGFVNSELVSRGMIADVSIHAPKEGNNFHAHILCSMREISPEGFGKKVREWNDVSFLKDLRSSWETHCNNALEEAGSTERVDCRSLETRGLDAEPEPKVGVAATALERKGVETERGNYARSVRLGNVARPFFAGLKQTAERYFAFEQGTHWMEKLHNGMTHMQAALGDLLVDESSGRRRSAICSLTNRQAGALPPAPRLLNRGAGPIT
jgi:hypothetical protein